MELTLDIFRNDAFSYVSLQRVADNSPYVPSALGAMGLFQPVPIETREVLLYEKDGGFALIPTTEIGSPDVQQVRRQGRLRGLRTVRIAKKDTVQASELTGIANMALPESVRMRNAMALVSERTEQLKTDMEATKELHRLGALQGKLLDADGTTVIYNYFAQYGIADPVTVDIDFADYAEEELMQAFQETFYVPMVTMLGNRWNPNVRIAALVGDGFWGKLMRHPVFYKLYMAMIQGRQIAMEQNPLIKPNNWETIYFAGVYWTNFRGSTGGEIAVPYNDAVFFPIGAKDVFNVYWAPGETLKDAMDKGKPQYLYVQTDPRDQMPSFVDIFLRAYPLYACIFPKVLMRARVQ
jgi:hypothetical protein